MRYFSGLIYLYTGTKGLYLQLATSVGLEIVLQATPLHSAVLIASSIPYSQHNWNCRRECLAHKTRQEAGGHQRIFKASWGWFKCFMKQKALSLCRKANT